MGRRLKTKIKLPPYENEIVEESKHWEELREESIKARFHIQPKNKKQEAYLHSIEDNIITIGIGFAGSGRSYCACGMAAKLLDEGKVEKIILTRPLVECGESMGFLPGTQEEKMMPYMAPLIDAFDDFYGEKVVKDLIHQKKIVIAPLALMRGSSFKNSIIILDEASNCSYSELKMALTRIGENCRMVISADYTQSDLDGGAIDLLEIVNKIKNLAEVSIIKFTKEDTVRSGVVKHLLEVLG